MLPDVPDADNPYKPPEADPFNRSLWQTARYCCQRLFANTAVKESDIPSPVFREVHETAMENRARNIAFNYEYTLQEAWLEPREHEDVYTCVMQERDMDDTYTFVRRFIVAKDTGRVVASREDRPDRRIRQEYRELPKDELHAQISSICEASDRIAMDTDTEITILEGQHIVQCIENTSEYVHPTEQRRVRVRFNSIVSEMSPDSAGLMHVKLNFTGCTFYIQPDGSFYLNDFHVD